MVQLLATLALRHESQLQALAVQDTFILFLQPRTSSIIPVIQQTTLAWKQEVEQKTATQSLRHKLVTMISQTLLDRMLKVTQATTTMDIWQEAIRHSLIETGNQQTKQVQVMQKQAISITSTQSLLEELVELIWDPAAVVRFKSLKASDQDTNQTKIMPCMLQVSVRLSNFQNDCYQNAAFPAMLRGKLQLKDPMWNELGEGSEKFAEPFGMDSMWISLKDLPGFGEFLRPWGEGQQDLHEFLGRFLQWVKPLFVNSSWQRIVQGGDEIRITDRGAPHNPPTLSAPVNTAETDLQTLVDGWTHYLGTQTTFTARGRLACLHLDRFAHDDQGHLRKCSWNLEVNARIWLPIQGDKKLTFVQHPYIVVAAVSHQGQDEAGHLQASGLSAQGWVVFNDLVEARVIGSQPPLTDSWIFVWLAREDAIDLGLGRFGLLGTDTFPRAMATLHQQHAMHVERYPLQRLWQADHLPRGAVPPCEPATS